MFDMAVVVAVVIALGEFAKKYIAAKYIPLVSLVIGILAGVVYLPMENIQTGIVNGVIVGLTACGLFDISKVVRK